MENSNNEKSNQGIDRRNFFKTGALVSGGSLILKETDFLRLFKPFPGLKHLKRIKYIDLNDGRHIKTILSKSD